MRSWRKLSFAGAPMPDWVQRAMMEKLPEVRLTQIYGQSEMGVVDGAAALGPAGASWAAWAVRPTTSTSRSSTRTAGRSARAKSARSSRAART